MTATWEQIEDMYLWSRINWAEMEEEEADRMERGNGTVPGSAFLASQSPPTSKSRPVNSGSPRTGESSAGSSTSGERLGVEGPTDTSNNPNTQSTEAEPDIILICLRILDGSCDGARRLDGHGFNKFDTDKGKALAAKDQLTHDERVVGLRIVRKYKKQIPLEYWNQLPVSVSKPSFMRQPSKDKSPQTAAAPKSKPKYGGRKKELGVNSPYPFGGKHGPKSDSPMTFLEIAEDDPDYGRWVLDTLDDKPDITAAMEEAMMQAGRL